MAITFWKGFTLALSIPLALVVTCATGAEVAASAAAQHAGETATVCGTVAGARYARRTKGAPTFVNLDRPYPHPIFTVVIWGTYREEFDPPPETWRGRLCVTGRIKLYRGVPEIDVIDPSQVTH